MRLKVLSCVLVGVLCFGGLIGCSGSSGAEQSLASTGSTEQSVEAAKAAEEEAAHVEAERKAAEEAAKAEAEEKARQEAAAAEAAAEAQAQAEAQAEDTNGYTVYITETGKKYHSGGCRHVKKSKIAIDINDARAQGYEPCSVCNP